MSGGQLLTKLPWGIAAVVLTLGIVLRDCVLVSSSVLFLMHGFYSSMDRAQPWDSLRAALHCWVMSAGLFVVALGLLTWIAVAMVGALTPHNDNPVATIAVLGASVWLLAATQEPWTSSTCAVILGALFASAITLYLNELGLAYAPCVFAAGVSAVAGATASRLAFRVAPEILRGGVR